MKCQVPFPIEGQGEIWREAIGEAWRQIVDRFPEDSSKLANIVKCVRIVRMEKGDVGEWRPLYPNPSDPSQVCEDNKDGPGDIWLNSEASIGDAVMVVLHELGHAATTYEDIDLRRIPSEEWASEASADYHAAKWGGVDRLKKFHAERDSRHHGAVPGQSVEVYGKRYRLNDDFTYVYLGQCAGLHPMGDGVP
jgi:hypothetical protein